MRKRDVSTPVFDVDDRRRRREKQTQGVVAKRWLANRANRVMVASAVSFGLVGLASAAPASAAPCTDTDGDGWGWDGDQTCTDIDPTPVQGATGPCADPDGDGWGWNGRETCTDFAQPSPCLLYTSPSPRDS